MMKDDIENKVFFVSGGGTGGHIYPALAVVDELRKNGAKKIFYIGNPKNPECKLAKENNIDFLPINVKGMPRTMSIKFLFWMIKLFFAVLVAIKYVLKYKPDMIFGTGGYVSAPILFAAKFMKKKFMLHDADAHPGIVTRCFVNYAQKLSTPFEEVKNLFPSANVEVTGNPIRNEFFELTKQEAKEKLGFDNKITLLVMGGSQGAKSINKNFIPDIKKLIDEFDIHIIHQSGNKNFDDVKALLDKEFPDYKVCKNYQLLSYIDDMPLLLKASDIAISRSGSLSLSEIMASEVASILIPYPYSSGDHQKVNAQAMVNLGCSIMFDDFELNSEKLYNTISDLIKNQEKLKSMQNIAHNNAKPDATKKIVENIINAL